MDPLSIAGLGVGLVGGIGNLFGGGRAKREMKRLLKNDPVYQVSEYAKQGYGHAQALLNARMPGATAMEKNIQSSQANQLSNINRLATDSSQALALAAGVQGTTNQAYSDLGVQESQDYYNRLQNMNSAQQGMISEGDKVFQDRVRRWENMAQAAGANIQNRAGAWNSLSNLGFGIANFGMSGGFNNMFGGGSAAAGGTTLLNSGNRQLPAYTKTVPLASYR